MIECSKCGKTSLEDIQHCELKKKSRCEYQFKTYRELNTHYHGWSLLLLGVFFLIAVLFFPLSSHNLFGNSMFASLMRMIILSVLLLLGGFATYLGYSILTARKKIVYSISQLQSIEEFYFGRNPFRLRAVHEAQLIEFVPVPAEISAFSIYSAGDINKILGLVNNDNINQIDNRAIYLELVRRVLLATLVGLLNKKQIKLVLAKSYNSSAKQISHTDSSKVLLILPGEHKDLPAIGNLERKILEIVNGWQANAHWSKEPIAPSVPLLFEILNIDPLNLGIFIKHNLISDIPVASNELYTEYQHCYAQLYNANSSVINYVEKVLQEHLLVEPKQNLAKRLGITNPNNLRYLRIGLAVSTILLVTLGRYISSLEQVKMVTKTIAKSATKHNAIWQDELEKALQTGTSDWNSLNAKSKREIKSLLNDLPDKQSISELYKELDRQSQNLLKEALVEVNQATLLGMDFINRLAQQGDEITKRYANHALEVLEQNAENYIKESLPASDLNSLSPEQSIEELVGYSDLKSKEFGQAIESASKSADKAIHDKAVEIMEELDIKIE